MLRQGTVVCILMGVCECSRLLGDLSTILLFRWPYGAVTSESHGLVDKVVFQHLKPKPEQIKTESSPPLAPCTLIADGLHSQDLVVRQMLLYEDSGNIYAFP